MKLIHWDCLEEMDKLIEQWIKVDAIITDPPYWKTACKWDSVIPFDAMWERLNKLIKPNWAIVLFGSEPFSSALRMSNIKNYKYDWMWQKQQGTNPMLAKKRPLKDYENIIVFNANIYNPQMSIGKPYSWFEDKRKKMWEAVGGGVSKHRNNPSGSRYPKTIIKFNTERSGFHPTQKPVALMEYLIKTYTNEWETVLDFTMWSWTTGVACKKLNREFIGIELDDKYFEIAKNRIESA